MKLLNIFVKYEVFSLILNISEIIGNFVLRIDIRCFYFDYFLCRLQECIIFFQWIRCFFQKLLLQIKFLMIQLVRGVVLLKFYFIVQFLSMIRLLLVIVYRLGQFGKYLNGNGLIDSRYLYVFRGSGEILVIFFVFQGFGRVGLRIFIS